MAKRAATVGVSDHAGWAVLVTVAAGKVLDRRRIELIDAGLPILPHHHEAQGLPIREGVALVERVRTSANAHAAACLDALAKSHEIAAIALRECPALPATVAERITNYRAQTMADTVMYREALAGAAKARGWGVLWFDARQVFDDAARAFREKSIDDLLETARTTLGRPWTKDHRLAMAAAIAASAPSGGSRSS